jgi:hypothetical protein
MGFSSGVDGGHAHVGEQLPVAAVAAVVLAALLLEDEDFLGLALPQNFTHHPGSGHQGLAHLDGVAVSHQEHLLQDHFIPPLSGEVFHPENVSGGNPVLFPASLNNGEQSNLQKKSNL